MIGMLTGRELATRAEWIDTMAWLDQHRAAPPEVTAGLDLAHRRDGDLAMVRSAVPFSHFNMVLTLGCPAAADDGAWAAVEELYGGAGHWLVANDHSLPADLPSTLAERGYAPVEVWDRIVCQEPSGERWAPLAGGAEVVTADTAGEWIGFVLGCYGMPPIIGRWLEALVDRPGWVHAVLRRDGRPGGEIVMARSAFVHDGWCWLGIDAPVPGVMAPCFDDDQQVSAALLLAAAELGAHSFVTDIEAPSDDRTGPAYDRWSQLGFEPAYRRTVHHRAQR